LVQCWELSHHVFQAIRFGTKPALIVFPSLMRMTGNTIVVCAIFKYLNNMDNMLKLTVQQINLY